MGNKKVVPTRRRLAETRPEKTILYAWLCPKLHLILGVSQTSSKKPGDKDFARASEVLKEELRRRFINDESIARCGTCGAGPERWSLNVFTSRTEEKAQAHLRGLDQTRLGEMIRVWLL